MYKTLAKQIKQKEKTLVELVGSIVNDFDILSLQEIHENRDMFRYKEKRSLLLVDYLYCLSQSRTALELCNNKRILTEKAYDLTLSKFFEIPQKHLSGSETGGIDCRYYFRAFMDYFKKKHELKGLHSPLDIELQAASFFQSFVTRHFYLSCLECIRQERKMFRRYQWRLSGQIISIWMPSEMTGSMCRNWLNSTIEDIDLCQIGEKDRIQQIVYDRLGRKRLVSLCTFQPEVSGIEYYESPVSDELPNQGLAEMVSQEKSERIDQLNHKIAGIGAERLKQMILEIFEELLSGRCQARDIALRYGLDKVTFSRFAGTRWSNSDNITTVPVLWKNTASILAADDRFVEAAKNSGLWDRIRMICK